MNMKQTVYSCDLCGEVNTYIPEDWIKIKAKKRWYAYPNDKGWANKDILICDNCQHRLKAIFTAKETPSFDVIEKSIEITRDEFVKRKESDEYFNGYAWTYDDKVVQLGIEFIPKEAWIGELPGNNE